MTAPLTLEERVARIETILGLDPAAASPQVPWPLRRGAVLREAARLWDVDLDELVGVGRTRDLVIPRAAIVLTLRENPPLSYPQIGRLLNRDHSSIINLHRIGLDEWTGDVVFRAKLEQLKRIVDPAPRAPFAPCTGFDPIDGAEPYVEFAADNPTRLAS